LIPAHYTPHILSYLMLTTSEFGRTRFFLHTLMGRRRHRDI
jgi:hypothetical protein